MHQLDPAMHRVAQMHKSKPIFRWDSAAKAVEAITTRGAPRRRRQRRLGCSLSLVPSFLFLSSRGYDRTADRDHCSRGERGRFNSLYERSRCHSREINSATGPRRSLCSGRGYPYTRPWEVHLMGRQSHIVRNTVRGKIPDWLRRRSEDLGDLETFRISKPISFWPIWF